MSQTLTSCSCGRHFLAAGEVLPSVPEKRLGSHSRERCTFDGIKPRLPALRICSIDTSVLGAE